MGVDDAGDRDPAARELLDDHRVGRQVEAHPAVLLGDRDPEEAELLHLLDDRLGELVLGVVVLRVGEDLLVDELADHLDDGLLLVGLLVEAGWRRPCPGTSGAIGRASICRPGRPHQVYGAGARRASGRGPRPGHRRDRGRAPPPPPPFPAAAVALIAAALALAAATVALPPPPWNWPPPPPWPSPPPCAARRSAGGIAVRPCRRRRVRGHGGT